MNRKFNIGDMVTLVAPPAVRIIGVQEMSKGPGLGNQTTYMIFDGNQVHQGVTEDQIDCVNLQATKDARAADAKIAAEVAARDGNVRRLQAVKTSQLADAVNGNLAAGHGLDGPSPEAAAAMGGQERQSLAEDFDKADQKFAAEADAGVVGDDEMPEASGQ